MCATAGTIHLQLLGIFASFRFFEGSERRDRDASALPQSEANELSGLSFPLAQDAMGGSVPG
jgi:hypothetical protein